MNYQHLHEAFENADLETITRLLSPYPAELTPFGWTPLLLSIEHGNAAVVRLVLSLGGDLSDRSTADGCMPLHLVVDRIADGENQTGTRDDDGWDILRLLLDAGADVHAKDSQGGSAIDAAARYHRADIQKVLLAGA